MDQQQLDIKAIRERSEKAKTLGWWTMVASIDEILAMVTEIERLRSTLAEYEANRAEFEAWLAGVRSY